MPKARLVELYARGLGVIDETRVEFGGGFNVLTGETGAGKTLLLGALELCLGGDGSSSRHAMTTETQASAVFEQGGREVVLARETSATGRLRSSVNGAPSSADALRTLAGDLVVIHGQHDSLALRTKSEILRIIDVAGGVDTSELSSVRHELMAAYELRATLGGDPAQREREREFLNFQIAELEGAAITGADELASTLQELQHLSALRENQATLLAVVEALDGDGDAALLSLLANLIQRLPNDPSVDEARQVLRDALENARDAGRRLASLADPEAFDDAVLAELDERVRTLQTIARKYGGSLEAALATLDALRQERDARDADTEKAATLESDIAALEARHDSLARQARRDREFAAVHLTEAVRRQLPRVALANATLRFAIEGDDGSDAQILFTPNPGLAEGPLQALASGGELSRVLLALSLETAHEDVVAIFDEVDAGVGGQVAQQIGECLRELGQNQQVLAITHLASVAAKADHHFVITKQVQNGVSTTSVRRVEGDERVREISRMLAGDELTDESLALAARLLGRVG